MGPRSAGSFAEPSGARAPAAPYPRGASLPETAMSRNTVVVVEDEPLVRLTATSLFEEAGIVVVEFADGDAAIDYVRDHKADVAAIFTDVYLPGDTDGLELAAIVTAVCPDIAVLVTSGNHRTKPTHLGPHVRYVPKPWHPADVLHTMQDAMRSAA